ncbi:MAG: hypothetical protein ACM3JP_01915, partial [Betaproteobacteria bacterium]
RDPVRPDGVPLHIAGSEGDPVNRVATPALISMLLVGILPSVAQAATGPKFDMQPGGGAPGVAWAQQPRVAIKTGNNIVTSATGTITLAITSGTGTSGAVLSCAAKTVSLSSGIAPFSGCSIDKAGTGYRLTATWSQGGTVDSSTFNITAPSGTATKLGFTSQPARGTPGGAFAVQPTVAIQDAAGATVSTAPATTITLTLGANPGGGTLTCTGGQSKTTVNGVATFGGCKIDRVGVGYTLVATASPLTSATSSPFDVADRLVFTTQPGGASSGVAFTTQPVVAVRAGPTVTASHDSVTSVTLSIKSGTGASGAVLICTGGLSRTVVAGVATFTGCAIDKASPTSPAAPYVLVATAAGLTSASSASLTVAAGPALMISTSAPVITWGNAVSISVGLSASGANRAIQVQGSKNGTTWSTITTLTTNGSGAASFTYRPATNLYYRALFAGAADLGALTSNTVRTVVRQVSILRPTNFGAVKRISRGTAITFVDTVRPSRPELIPATVRFVFYRRASTGVWVLSGQRDVVVSSTGQAGTRWTFSVGEWYVRSQARPTPNNANSVWGPLERYSVR